MLAFCMRMYLKTPSVVTYLWFHPQGKQRQTDDRPSLDSHLPTQSETREKLHHKRTRQTEPLDSLTYAHTHKVQIVLALATESFLNWHLALDITQGGTDFFTIMTKLCKLTLIFTLSRFCNFSNQPIVLTEKRYFRGWGLGVWGPGGLGAWRYNSTGRVSNMKPWVPFPGSHKQELTAHTLIWVFRR